MASTAPHLTPAEVPARLAPVILGGDILAYSYVRCLHEAYGVKPLVLASAEIKVLSTSSLCSFEAIPDIDQTDVLLERLEELGRQYEAEGKVGLVLGSGDWYARILSEHKEELAPWFHVPYIDFPLLDDITQKERFYALCEELGMDYPRTWTYDCSDPDGSIDLEPLTFPVIAKPSNSAAYHYAEFPGKKKIFEVQTPEELQRIYRELQKSCYDRELIVQEFIPGGDDALRTVTLFVDRDGDVRVSCSGRVVLQDHAPSAIGNPVVIVDDWVQEAIDSATRFVKAVGYRGYANFDVKIDERDGSAKFFEVNTRPGRNSYYVTLGGVNFVAPIVEEFVCDVRPAKQEARNPFCFACVPAYVVKRSLPDGPFKERVLEDYRSGLAQFPLFNKADSPAHNFWALLTYWNQVPKFDRYYWKTGGLQADAD